jgi:hypothetical protein
VSLYGDRSSREWSLALPPFPSRHKLDKGTGTSNRNANRRRRETFLTSHETRSAFPCRERRRNDQKRTSAERNDESLFTIGLPKRIISPQGRIPAHTRNFTPRHSPIEYRERVKRCLRFHRISASKRIETRSCHSLGSDSSALSCPKGTSD